ncbi:MAG: DUF2235 domain-containing protein, partial [Methylacidiphilales bacterium]|nr:DUF2235 domain-containing protein [Candidatus Methylacidiphilales bacterium]
YANGDPVNYIDPTGRAGYFIDGTHYSELGQNGSHDGSNNVYLLSQNYNGPRASHYYRGVGNDLDNTNTIAATFMGITGYGAGDIASNVYNDIVKNYNVGDTSVIMAAWSRGNLVAEKVDSMITQYGIPDLSAGTKIEVSYAGYPGAVSTIKSVPNAYLVAPYSNQKVITQMHMIDPVYAMGPIPFAHYLGGYDGNLSSTQNAFTYLATDNNISLSLDGLLVGTPLNFRTYDSNSSIQYFSSNHADVAGAGSLHAGANVYNAIINNAESSFGESIFNQGYGYNVNTGLFNKVNTNNYK